MREHAGRERRHRGRALSAFVEEHRVEGPIAVLVPGTAPHTVQPTALLRARTPLGGARPHRPRPSESKREVPLLGGPKARAPQLAGGVVLRKHLPHNKLEEPSRGRRLAVRLIEQVGGIVEGQAMR